MKLKKIISCLLSSLFIGSFCASVPVIGSEAKTDNKQITGDVYLLEDSKGYDIPVGTTSSSETPMGILSIQGDFETETTKSGVQSFVVKTGNVETAYTISGKLATEESRWHIVEDKTKKIAGETLDNNILQGVIVIFSSFDGNDWTFDEAITDIFNSNKASLTSVYEANEIQLQNGCFYKIIVAYKQEKKGESKKILFVDNIATTDERWVTEEYKFYLEYKDKGQMLDPNTKPRMEFGGKNQPGQVQAVKKSNGYAISTAQPSMSGKDPHYGWAMGRFVINGYTDEVEEDGTPVFLKNVGDQITLWYVLDKIDIMNLNGEGTLEVSEDKDGYDVDYGISKTNFKHGALIVKHLNSENDIAEPVLYTDFLSACQRTGANTRISIFEEGDYEVALDYQLKKTPRKVGNINVIPEYSDYKTVFRFKIRNGNCMVSAFDLSKGNELRDGEITNNGFRIDFAGSKYVSANVTKTTLSGKPGEKKLNQNFNKVVNEGDYFTDEGIYTVTVTNKYVNQPTVKTIYVGEDEYLLAMSKTGKNIQEINELINQGYYVTSEGDIEAPVGVEEIEEPISETAPEQPEKPAEPLTVATSMQEGKETEKLVSTVDAVGMQGVSNVSAKQIAIIVMTVVIILGIVLITRKKNK